MMERILIVGPAWVGDMVMAQSLFKVLHERSSQTEIDVLAPAWTEPLLKCMPEVRQAIAMPLGHGQLGLGVRRRLGVALRAHQYDQAIVLPGSFKSALVPFFAKIPKRTGFTGELRWGLLNDVRPLDKLKLSMTVQRFVALGRDINQGGSGNIPVPRLDIKQSVIAEALGRLTLARPAKSVLALCPGAEYGPAKQWPAEYFAEIARARVAAGWDVWVFGSEKDRAIAETICDLSGTESINLAGRTSLQDAIHLLALTDAVVSNDSGLMHVASALDKPLVAIYGSSSPNFTPPLHDKASIISLGLECSPCFKRECPYGHTNCLRNIKPETILVRLEEMSLPLTDKVAEK